MSNFRVFYPLNYIAIKAMGAADHEYEAVKGVQSADMTASFDLEQVFQQGQLDVYQNIENLPNVELTVEKVLDGYPLIYHLATQSASQETLVQRSRERCDVVLSVFSEDNDNSEGTPLTQAVCEGMYVESVDYNIPVEGNTTESVTLVGNDRFWIDSDFKFDGHFDGDDAPADEVQRRQHVIMGDDAGSSVWPTLIPGMTVTSGQGHNVEDQDGVLGVHIQDVDISVNLSREDLFELGRRTPYYRYATYPIAVDTTINIIAAGDDPSDGVDIDSESENLTDEPIHIKLSDSTEFDLGTRNRLESINYTTGDTGGSNAVIAYNFQNFNTLTVRQDNDPGPTGS